MKNIKLTIVDPKQGFIDLLNEYFSDVPEVTAIVGDFRAHRADALVSPANCFGIMDGGIDGLYTELIGRKMQRDLQARILSDFHGELPIGMSIDIKLDNNQFKWLISAPTMRTPQNIANTNFVYLAFRSMLLTAIKNPEIETVLTPGFGTGTGKMNIKVAATQMKLAWNAATQPAKILDFDTIIKTEDRIYNPDAW